MSCGKNYKMRITTYDNEPVIKATAERIEDFDNIMNTLKKKFGVRK